MIWVDRFPERLEYELAEFDRRGLAFTLDEELLRREQRVVVRGSISIDAEPDPIELEVRYPDVFPYLRPEVFAPNLQLDRHQNPFDRNLCLLDRSTRAWNPEETAASLIAKQVPYLLQLLREGGEALRQGEVPQGEPASYYIPILPGTVVFIPEALLELPANESRGFAQISIAASERPSIRLRGLLASASVNERGSRSRRLAEAPAALRERFSGATVEARWVRLPHPPRTRDADGLLAEAEQVAPGIAQPRWQTVAEGAVAVVGIVFSEEIRQGEFGDAWIFVVHFRDGGSGATGVYATRGDRLSPADLRERIPGAAATENASVAVIGLGALGAPLTLELARLQVPDLRILDFDFVETGTTVRWPFGLSAVGAPKPEFLQFVLEREFAYTDVKAFNRMIGGTPEGRRDSDFDVLAQALDGADLVIDATAEIGIQQLVSTLADERGLPQIYVWATEGARGGAVARVVPETTGCWYCLQLAFERESISLPPHDETGTVQPRGCGSRTFTGAAHDLLPIVAQATRTVVATLAYTHDGDGDGEHVFIGAYERPAPQPLTWTAHPLPRQEGCPCCAGGRRRPAQ